MTTTTFADYAAQQEARQNIANAVLAHTYALCEALRQNYLETAIKGHKRHVEKGENAEYHIACIEKLRNGISPVDFIVDSGRKYHKVIFVDGGGSRSVHAFIDKKTGQVYKSASWKAPAKGVRFDLRLIEQREWLLQHADWAGGYLYLR
jgi:hypothetical protein